MEQLRCLEIEGCSQVQGFLLSPARPVHEIPAVIKSLIGPCDKTIGLLPRRRRAAGDKVALA